MSITKVVSGEVDEIIFFGGFWELPIIFYNLIGGWEIAHIKPVPKGGTDELDNLQALNSAANAKKGNLYPRP
ncbi:MAG: HNH endonuclease signature motif containing protein [Sedimentisphaerales bacterium]